MSERLAIQLPDDLSEAQQDELVAALEEIDEVEEATNLGPARSVDLATISVGVQVASNVAGLLAPVVRKIIAVLRGRRLKHVTLTFPDGTTVAVDDISGEELDALLTRVGK